MTKETKEFIDFVNTVRDEFSNHKRIAIYAKAGEDLVDFYDEKIDFLERLNKIADEENLKINYLNQFQIDIQSIYHHRFPFRGQTVYGRILHNTDGIIQLLNINKPLISEDFEKLEFKLDFFKKLGFFNNNIVAIGANGSGKTSLSNKLKAYMSNNGVVISAQRILLVPNFDSIHNPNATLSALRQIQSKDKTNKNPNDFSSLQNEFQIILKNLLAENIALGNEYRNKAIESSSKGDMISSPSISNLDKTFKIWNSLIEHRRIGCKDGMNITVELENGTPYPAIQMSEGEKVMLYLIAQVLQAPVNGFIIVDEPEMYLHKTILKKLWDILEKQRQDCIFIYLTHDLDFATSRTTAKKIWIKSFIYPEQWDMENLPENELPESLLMELLGSRKNILFCEGEKGKIDEKIYNILFPDFTITPVGGCLEVINHTKAFNKIPNIAVKAFGLIDSDHHPSDRLSKLKSHKVYHFKVAEVENLLLDEEFLIKLGSNIMADPKLIINIKVDVIDELKKYKEAQASNFVSDRIDYYFKDSNLKKGNSLEDIQTNFEKFTDEINIKQLYQERLKELEQIISSSDFVKTISVFNHKGINKCVERYFKITDFTDRAIKLLQSDESTHALLLKYFPQELVNENNN